MRDVTESGTDVVGRIRTRADLVDEIDRLRRRAARGSQRPRVSLDRIAAATGIPRSTVHAYVQGARLPPADALDAMVVSLGATPVEQRQWADAWDRVAGGTDADPQRQPAPAAPPQVVPRQLPAPPARFHGRSAAIVELDRVIDGRSERPRVVAVSGTGGVGKTALVLHWAHTATDAFPDGQLWVDLRGFGAPPALEPTDVLERLLRAVGIGTAELPNDVDARAALFRSAVAGRTMLLVLDNARDSAQVQPLLPASPGFVTIVTSRNTLRSLVASTGAERIQVGRMTPDEALELLVADLPDEVVGELKAAQIAEHCEGLPLALRIVHERVSVATPDEVREFADDLGRGRRERLAALDLNDSLVDVSVRGALRWSYAALSPEAALVFRRLPLCLVPAMGADVVGAVSGVDAGRARRLLDVLVAANLVERAGSDLYRIHDLVATFADERMAAEDDAATLAAARHALTEHVGRTVDSAMLCIDPQRPMRLAWPETDNGVAPQIETFTETTLALRWITVNADLIVALVTEVLTHGPPEHAWALVERGWRSLYPIAALTQFEPVLQQATELADRMNAPTRSMLMQRFLGITYGRVGRRRESMRACERAKSTAIDAGESAAAAMDAANMGMLLAMSGELGRAAEMISAALTDLDNLNLSPSISTLIEIELDRGDFDAAGGWLARMGDALEAKPDTGSLALEADSLAAQLALELGCVDEARERLAIVEPAARDSGNRYVLSQVLTMRARLLRDGGDLAGAEEVAVEATIAARDLGIRRLELDAIGVHGDVMRLRGRHNAAVRLLTGAIADARAAQLPYPECRLLVHLSRAQRDAGDVEDAAGSAGAAIEIAESCDFRMLEKAAGEALVAAADSTQRG